MRCIYLRKELSAEFQHPLLEPFSRRPPPHTPKEGAEPQSSRDRWYPGIPWTSREYWLHGACLPLRSERCCGFPSSLREERHCNLLPYSPSFPASFCHGVDCHPRRRVSPHPQRRTSLAHCNVSLSPGEERPHTTP